MKNGRKVILGVALSLMILFTAIGYAQLEDYLDISGILNAEAPKALYITDISYESGLDLNASVSGNTGMSTNITGASEQTAVYKITVRNNTDKTYIYTGVVEDNDNVSVTASMGKDGAMPIPSDVGTGYVSGPLTGEGLNREAISLVGPGETFEFYTTYTLSAAVSAEEILVDYSFREVSYKITYINNEKIYDIRYVYDDSVSIDVTNDTAKQAALDDMKADGYNVSCDYWMNAGNTVVETIPAKDANSTEPMEDIELYPKFTNLYTAMFVDQDGNILEWDFYSGSGDIDKIRGMAENAEDGLVFEEGFSLEYWEVHGTKSNGDPIKTKLDDYTFSDGVDVTIYPYFLYEGAELIPIDSDSDGDVDNYQVAGYTSGEGSKLVEIPGSVNGKPVTTINADAFNSYEDLTAVRIPAAVNYIGGKAFADSNSILGQLTDRQTVTLYYEGTTEQWANYMTLMYDGIDINNPFASNWDYAMGEGSRVFFLDADGKVIQSAGYWELNKIGTIDQQGFEWNYHNHAFPYNSTQHTSCEHPNDHNQNTTDYDAADRVDQDYWTWIVTFDYNDDGATESTMVNVVYNTSTTLPTPTRDGYTFAGWSDGTNTYAAGVTFTPGKDVTLTALWTPN